MEERTKDEYRKSGGKERMSRGGCEDAANENKKETGRCGEIDGGQVK